MTKHLSAWTSLMLLSNEGAGRNGELGIKKMNFILFV